MPNYTETINLRKTNMATDGDDLFLFDKDLDENWDKIDNAIAAKFDKSAIPNQQGQTDKYLSTDGNSLVFKKISIPFEFYQEGEILNEEKNYKQLAELKRSTFAVSKFNVIGSPVISDDGIASGFDNSNYIQAIQLKHLANKSWTIKAKWINQGKTSTTSNVNIVFDMGSYRAWGSISFSITLKQLAFFSRTGTKDDTNNEKAWAVKYLSDIPNYIIASISFDIKTGTYTAKADWGEGEVLIGTYTPTTENKQLYVINNFPDKYIRIGTGSDNEYNKNAIDLKQFSILVDGVEIFCGNETGVDLIKADDYTLIGSPEISDDGIASGFSGSNYLKTNLIALKNNWIIKIKVNFANIADMLSPLFFYSGYNRIILGTDGTITIFASSDNVTAKSLNFSNVVIEVNKNYLLTISFDGVSNYKLIAENLDDKTTAESVKQLASKFPEDPINWFIGGDGERYIQGKIDLNSFKIYTDSDLVYQPCLKIPYIKTKGASKIVDSLYRDRVSDVFEQKGNADYFTLDEENQNFSLPYGEIYGMKADSDLNNLTELGKKVIDGQWVQSVKELSTATAVGTYTIDLADYLPVDDYSYEIYINADAYTESNVARTYISAMNNDMTTSKITLLWGASYARQNTNIARVIADKTRKITIQHEQGKWSGFNLNAIGYRRLGTNS